MRPVPCPNTFRSTAAHRGTARPCAGFTLLETALATVILGVGILALIDAQASFTRLNDTSSSSATGAYLANELRERMRDLPRHDPVTGLYTSIVNGQSTLAGWGRETGESTLADMDDLDDFDGVSFGTGGTFPGPIDATGRVLAELDSSGNALVANGAQVNMRGWTQAVAVEKVDPRNFATVRARNYAVAANGSIPATNVDQFPVRVTIVVSYTAPGTTRVDEMARVVFIAPP